MKFIRQFVLPLGALVALAMVITIASPRAVHAVVATMVQVVNTPTSAVPILHAPAASQIYQETCHQEFLSGYTTATCGTRAVPSGQTLFVETVSMLIRTDPGNNTYQQAFGYVTNPPIVQVVPIAWLAIQPTASTSTSKFFAGNWQVRYSVAQSMQPTCYAGLVNPTNSSDLVCTINGYLAPAQ